MTTWIRTVDSIENIMHILNPFSMFYLFTPLQIFVFLDSKNQNVTVNLDLC